MNHVFEGRVVMKVSQSLIRIGGHIRIFMAVVIPLVMRGHRIEVSHHQEVTVLVRNDVLAEFLDFIQSLNVIRRISQTRSQVH